MNGTLFNYARGGVASLCLLSAMACSSVNATGPVSAPVVPVPPSVGSSPPTLIQQSTLYPRALRLSYGPAASNGRIVASTNGVIFQSVDGGISFTYLSNVGAVAGSTEFCCATLFEMPATVGSLAAGTLLSSAPYTLNGKFAIQVYTSVDAGKTWVYSSTVATGGTYVAGGSGNRGLYEPEFTVAKDGSLTVLWSDETDPAHNQKIAEARTTDGTTWTNQQDAVASSVYGDRPGMPVVSKLPDGVWFMSFELCGAAACTVYSKNSPDGYTWGNGAADVGAPILSSKQQHFEHAPFNVWTTKAGTQYGELVLVGQVLKDAGTGVPDTQNGLVVFTNVAQDGKGLWSSSVLAPVPVPSAYDNYCPNYSSALLPSVDGSSLLELASYYNASGVCLTYAGIGPLQ